MVQSRIKFLNRIDKIEQAVSDDPNYVFKFALPEKLRSPVVRVDEGYFYYGEDEEEALFKNVNF